MEEVFTPFEVFINHRGPDVKKTLASLLYHDLTAHRLSVFLDKQELRVGDSLTPAIRSAIRSASVQIVIFSKTYGESTWCWKELLWMNECCCCKFIAVFYDIEPSDLQNVAEGIYAEAFKKHREEGVTAEEVNRWIAAIGKVLESASVVVFNTETDDYGERLKQIVDIVLDEVGREQLYEGKYPMGLDQVAENFEKEVTNRGINVVGIAGPAGSGKSTLATRLYNNYSKCSRFERRCFLSDVSKRELPSLQENLVKDLLLDRNLSIQDTRKGRTTLKHRLQDLPGVLIVFDGIENQEQIDNLLFVKDIVGNDSLVLVTSRDRSLLISSEVEIYNVKLEDAKHGKNLSCWRAFDQTKRLHGLEDVVENSVGMWVALPSDLEVLARQITNKDDPSMLKQHLKSLLNQRPNNWWRGLWMDQMAAAFMPRRICKWINNLERQYGLKAFTGVYGFGEDEREASKEECAIQWVNWQDISVDRI